MSALDLFERDCRITDAYEAGKLSAEQAEALWAELEAIDDARALEEVELL